MTIKIVTLELNEIQLELLKQSFKNSARAVKVGMALNPEKVSDCDLVLSKHFLEMAKQVKEL